MDIDWTDEAAAHMWDSHRITPIEAAEAVIDPDAAVFSPDPAGKSGLADRIVGYSTSRAEILCVIALRDGSGYQLVNAWPANPTYRRIYREGATS